MKARLVKKLCSTPIDRLSDYWFDALTGGGRDERINTAIRIYRKKYGTDKTRSQAHQ